ncbi:MAG TPA: RNA-binding S4 domain-containing protein [Bacillota bacterium]|nr:RNA-binding S4 domain-containing protein [Clostridia bacterium]MDD3438622.1 RNA-binding S4 domain-containing protein [Clostridiaceae bacterium]HNR04378.1 RNA-binding S4 domain-containing protein [Bacillota bacterium]HNT03583.1 RNA-binding S4 domain-containing protein [Bacillota bacterium]HPL98407.1 RNA-binding S4 domain-containing protein [Bacillota bacterium]
MREAKIETDFIKLDQFLKFENIAGTGGEAKNMIMDGLVKVNGNIEKARGKKLRRGDVIEIFGEEIKLI